MPVEFTKEFMDYAGWEDLNKVTKENQPIRNKAQLENLKNEAATVNYSEEGRKSLLGDIEKLERTGLTPKESGIKLNFGDLNLDFNNKSKKVNDKILLPFMSPELKEFLGVEEQAPILLAAGEAVLTKRALIEHYNATGDWLGDDKEDPSRRKKTAPEPVSKEPVQYRDKEAVRREIDRRKQEGERRAPTPPPPQSKPISVEEDTPFSGGLYRDAIAK